MGGWAQVELTDSFIFGMCFSLRLLSYGDGDPSKPHLNLRGKHFLLLILCYLSLSLRKFRPKNLPYRAIFTRLVDYFGTPLFRRFLLLSIYNYD